MVLQKTVDNLKARSKDERKVIAGGVAIAVIAVLFLGWAFLFLKKIQSGNQIESVRQVQNAEPQLNSSDSVESFSVPGAGGQFIP